MYHFKLAQGILGCIPSLILLICKRILSLIVLLNDLSEGVIG